MGLGQESNSWAPEGCPGDEFVKGCWPFSIQFQNPNPSWVPHSGQTRLPDNKSRSTPFKEELQRADEDKALHEKVREERDLLRAELARVVERQGAAVAGPREDSDALVALSREVFPPVEG